MAKSKKEEVGIPQDEVNIIPVVKKKFSGLSDYKNQAFVKAAEIQYKPQGWIDMPESFKSVTKLPGIAKGAISMVYGKSDTGKTTLAVQSAFFALNDKTEQILPVFIITENKFSWDRAATMGVNEEDCLVFNNVQTIEDGIDLITKVLDDQATGKIPCSLYFVWDSIGGTPSRRENEHNKEQAKEAIKSFEEGKIKKDVGVGGMMITSKVLKETLTRNIGHKINASRDINFPYTNTLLLVNHGYLKPGTMGGPPSLIPNGGDGPILAASLVFRMGGVQSNSSKVTATKNGDKIGFAIKSALVVEKNHITNVAANGKIICTDHGFIAEDEIESYKKKYKDDWNLEYDKYWNTVNAEI